MAKKASPASHETLEPKVPVIYEIGYLMSPTVRDEDLEARVNDLRETITKLSATIIAEGNPEFIDLAYEMSRVIENKRTRFNQGYFGWIKFEVEPSQILVLKELLDKNTLIIRYLLIKSVRENTVIGKKPLGKILKGDRSAVTEGSELSGDASASATEDVPEAAIESGIVPDDVIEEVPAEQLDEVLDAEIKELVKEA